ncbi:MAG TPA: DNA polymerase III subunit delta' [Blastocatellia bacterium]|nr:DNA polymerase III subunit delta' [Blastocatellia bacterium]
MSFESIVGNDHNKDLLQRALRNGRLPNAFIFAGPEGIGKQLFALTLAKAINCEKLQDDSCDKCGSCHRIDKSESIDIKIVEPEKGKAFITIDAIRKVAAEAYATPMEARRRVFIIDPADKMNAHAMNGLLKTLEEPADTSLIILITSKPDSQLPTIRSRSQIIRFAPLTVDQVEGYLEAHFKRPPEDTRLLAKISGGRIGLASSIDLSVYREKRDEMVDVVDLLTHGKNRVKLVKLAEALGRREREEYEASLDILSSLLRDVVSLIANETSEQIANEDIRGQLESFAHKLDIQTITIWFERIEEVRRTLRVNINRPVATESLFLNLEAQRTASASIHRQP